MRLLDAAEVVIKELYARIGFKILSPRKVKFRTLEGEFVSFMTSDGFGFAPAENPEQIHWTIHTKRKIPKEKAFFHLLLPFFEEPAEFHEKVKGKVTMKFKGRTGYIPFGKFVKERMKERKSQQRD